MFCFQENALPALLVIAALVTTLNCSSDEATSPLNDSTADVTTGNTDIHTGDITPDGNPDIPDIGTEEITPDGSTDTVTHDADADTDAVTHDLANDSHTATDTEEGDLSMADLDCIPGGESSYMPSTISEYAAMCEPHLGVVPTVDCGEGVHIPIFVDGEEVFEDVDNCDNTDFKGGCFPGSRIGRIEGTDTDGSPLPDVVWVFFCRSAGAEWFEYGVVSVQMIGHNTDTGATCFFESPDAIGDLVQAEYLEFDEDGLLDGEMPGPDSPEFNRAWLVPNVQCVECHENNAFIHNPWIDGARLPGDPSQPVLPQLVNLDDPLASPYFVVGGSNWDMRTVHIEDNDCVSCHRASMRTAALFEESGIYANDFMPPMDPGSMTSDYAALVDCHNNGPESTPGCNWIIPPGGGCDGGVVGTDYPYNIYDGVIYDGGSESVCDELLTEEACLDEPGCEWDIDKCFDAPGGGGGFINGGECPEDLDLTAPCAPEEKCTIDGVWWWCQGGVWTTF